MSRVDATISLKEKLLSIVEELDKQLSREEKKGRRNLASERRARIEFRKAVKENYPLYRDTTLDRK